jgi:hypothetical protein
LPSSTPDRENAIVLVSDHGRSVASSDRQPSDAAIRSRRISL